MSAHPKHAVVLLSGGLDSAVALYYARSRGYECRCIAFDYGQRHRRELTSARAVARAAGSRLEVVRLALPWKGSSLLDRSIPIQPGCNAGMYNAGMQKGVRGIPATYVPGRNIIFLSFALSCAEAVGAEAVFIGAHAQDYSGYPDCRPEFFSAFSRAAAAGTKAGVEGRSIAILTPLLRMTKAQIIKLGARLRVPFALTWSCYRGGSAPCGKCESCFYRAKGFAEAGVKGR